MRTFSYFMYMRMNSTLSLSSHCWEVMESLIRANFGRSILSVTKKCCPDDLASYGRLRLLHTNISQNYITKRVHQQ